jgi:hypothetical protein
MVHEQQPMPPTVLEAMKRHTREALRKLAELEMAFLQTVGEPTPSLPEYKAAECKEWTLDNVHEKSPLLNRVCQPLRFSTRQGSIGEVYVFSNPAFERHTYKIGLTEHGVLPRARQLYTTGVPMPFHVEKSWQTRACRAFESRMHLIFKNVRKNGKREFFDAPLQLLIEVGDIVAQAIEEYYHAHQGLMQGKSSCVCRHLLVAHTIHLLLRRCTTLKEAKARSPYGT